MLACWEPLRQLFSMHGNDIGYLYSTQYVMPLTYIYHTLSDVDHETNTWISIQLGSSSFIATMILHTE